MKPDFTYYFLRWLTGFCEVVDGVFTVCTLGFFNPNATFAMVCYTSKRNINRMMEARRDGKTQLNENKEGKGHKKINRQGGAS